MLQMQQNASIIFPVIVTLLSDTTTSSTQMPILLAMVITLIRCYSHKSLQVSERSSGTVSGKSKSGGDHL